MKSLFKAVTLSCASAQLEAPLIMSYVQWSSADTTQLFVWEQMTENSLDGRKSAELHVFAELMQLGNHSESHVSSSYPTSATSPLHLIQIWFWVNPAGVVFRFIWAVSCKHNATLYLFNCLFHVKAVGVGWTALLPERFETTTWQRKSLRISF